MRDLGLSEESREQIAATLNFAEAALVLQHSSGVYSRKVDYLHTHVYKVQEELSSSLASTLNNNSKKAKNKQSKGIDKEVEAFLNFDPHNEFLLLDDVLPTDQTGECNKINLSESSAAADLGGDDPNLSIQTTGTTRLSMGSVFNRRLSLNASTNTLDQTNASRSSAAAPGSNHHLRAFLGAAKDTGSLRLTGGTCDIGEEGVLFLPGSQSSSQQEQPPTSLNVENGGNGVDSNPQDDDFDFGGGGGDGGGFDDDHDDGGAGFAMADNVEDENNNKDPSEMTAQQEKKRVTFADSTAAAAPLLTAKKPTVDPWACLDRDTPDNKGKPRPLRVGKTIVLPETLDALPSECVTGTRTRRIARKQRDRLHPSERRQQQQPPTHSSTETFQVSLGKRSLEDAIGNNVTAATGSGTNNTAAMQLKGLAYGNEFAYIAKATAKRKAEERRALRKQQMEEEAQLRAQSLEENGYHDGDDDDDDGGGFGFGGGDYDDDDDNDYGGGGGGDVFGDDDQGRGPTQSNTGLASVDDVYQKDYDGVSLLLDWANSVFSSVLANFHLTYYAFISLSFNRRRREQPTQHIRRTVSRSHQGVCTRSGEVRSRNKTHNASSKMAR